VTAPEWTLMAPPGVAIHVARATLYGPTSQSSYEAMARSTEVAAADPCHRRGRHHFVLLHVGDVRLRPRGDRAQHCRQGELPGQHRVRGGARGAASARRPPRALSTPYLDFVNEAEIRMLTNEGLDVVVAHGLGLGRTQAERRAMNRIPPEAVFKMAQRANHPDADAIFLSCAALAGVELIDRMEDCFGKPVITTNQATFWYTLRMLHLDLDIQGYGSLLRRAA